MVHDVIIILRMYTKPEQHHSFRTYLIETLNFGFQLLQHARLRTLCFGLRTYVDGSVGRGGGAAERSVNVIT